MERIERIRAFLNLAIDQELQAIGEEERPGAVWNQLLQDAEYLDPDGDGTFESDGELVLAGGETYRIIVKRVGK